VIRRPNELKLSIHNGVTGKKYTVTTVDMASLASTVQSSERRWVDPDIDRTDNGHRVCRSRPTVALFWVPGIEWSACAS
jgi:hypothetical protein